MLPLLICRVDRLRRERSDGGTLVIITIMLPLLICRVDRLRRERSDGARHMPDGRLHARPCQCLYTCLHACRQRLLVRARVEHAVRDHDVGAAFMSVHARLYTGIADGVPSTRALPCLYWTHWVLRHFGYCDTLVVAT